MIAQPACSCTVASLGELQTVLGRHPDRANVFIIFEQNDVGVDPLQSSLWAKASGISGATVLLDQSGSICRQFHAATSGQVFLYDANGALRYSGGITASRGHEGDSDGSRAIDSLLSGRETATPTAPVYGCSVK